MVQKLGALQRKLKNQQAQRKILLGILGLIREKEGWRIRYRCELYILYQELDIVNTVKLNKIIWLGHLQRIENKSVAKQLFLRRPHGKRNAGRWRDGTKKQISELATVSLMFIISIPLIDPSETYVAPQMIYRSRCV